MSEFNAFTCIYALKACIQSLNKVYIAANHVYTGWMQIFTQIVFYT